MKLKEYAELINKIANRYPNLEVIYSKDDEGNDFQEVVYEPSIGYFEDNEYSAFSNSVTTDENVILNEESCNAICIN